MKKVIVVFLILTLLSGGFYVYKNHISLFPTAEPINALKSRLGDFKLSKGTVQFTLNNTIPEAIIRKLLMYRIEGIDRLSL